MEEEFPKIEKRRFSPEETAQIVAEYQTSFEAAKTQLQEMITAGRPTDELQNFVDDWRRGELHKSGMPTFEELIINETVHVVYTLCTGKLKMLAGFPKEDIVDCFRFAFNLAHASSSTSLAEEVNREIEQLPPEYQEDIVAAATEDSTLNIELMVHQEYVRILERLRREMVQGIMSPETAEALIKDWEKIVRNEDGEEDPNFQVVFYFYRAELNGSAGFYQKARDDIRQAFEIAVRYHMRDWIEEIQHQALLFKNPGGES